MDRKVFFLTDVVRDIERLQEEWLAMPESYQRRIDELMNKKTPQQVIEEKIADLESRVELSGELPTLARTKEIK